MGEATPPAEELKTAIVAGRPVRRGAGEPAAEGHTWGEDRQLPADLLYELLVRPDSDAKPRAAILVGLRITGRLNFESADLQAPLIAHNCHFDAPVNLIAAKAPEISLTACHLPGLAADQLETRGALDLSRSTLELVGLLGAHIGGQLVLSGATLTGGGYPPDLGDGTLQPHEIPTESLDGMALVADGLQVDEGMFCAAGFTAEGGVRLLGAHIGLLSFERATLRRGLNADGLQVDQDLFCMRGFTAEGEVRLVSAHIGGQLRFGEATLSGDLNADGLQVDRGMFCTPDFTAEGEVRLLSAHIGGQLAFEGANLSRGLNADGLQVDDAMFCTEGFTAEGEVRLVGAHVGGQLAFDGATLRQGLRADGLRVDQGMFCAEGFVAEGEVRLLGARIGSQLVFIGAALTSTGLALDLEGARVDGGLFLRFAAAPRGGVDLTGARLGSLYDSESTWPAQLGLRGCEYTRLQASEDAPQQLAPGQLGGVRRAVRLRRLSPGRLDVQRRLRWIRLAEEGRLVTPPAPAAGGGYSPSPYTQLMTFYRGEGRDGDARRVAYERERRRRGELGLPGKAWNAFLQWTVGYGYKPLRALVVLSALVLVGSLVFSSFHSDGRLAAVKAEHQPFVASIYTLDRLIPVVSLGLRDAFAPSGAAQWWAFAYTLLGWMLTVAVVAGVNAAVRRE
ncbi:MAG TPA: hypothetical protein VF715_18370 [Thermoleophilaceae bacterium]